MLHTFMSVVRLFSKSYRFRNNRTDVTEERESCSAVTLAYSLTYIVENRHDKIRIQQEEDSLHQQIGLKFKQGTIEVLHLEHSFL